MATKTAGTQTEQQSTTELARGKECKGVVRFETQDFTAVVSNIYVSRAMPGINGAKKIRVTVEVID